jgi:[CysO sulfur-carrier protein]-S-L-cysteine hydrolase
VVASLPVLHLPADAHAAMLAHALACYPLEACGLIAGTPGDPAGAVWFVACDNVAASSKVYTLDPRQHLAADRRADDEGLEIIGVVHSHTHTEPYPSPTDVATAIDPGWHYLIISLRDDEPMLRSWRIVDTTVTEEAIVVVPGIVVSGA